MLKKRKNRCGFTLIELLAVIAIIAILASIVLGIAGAATKRAAIARAESAMNRMKLGLEEYKAEYGVYPQTRDTDKLIDLVYVEPARAGTRVFVEFLEGELTGSNTNEWIDPWGTMYEYDADPTTVNRRNNPDGYDLRSAGPDGDFDTGDDLTNW